MRSTLSLAVRSCDKYAWLNLLPEMMAPAVRRVRWWSPSLVCVPSTAGSVNNMLSVVYPGCRRQTRVGVKEAVSAVGGWHGGRTVGAIVWSWGVAIVAGDDCPGGCDVENGAFLFESPSCLSVQVEKHLTSAARGWVEHNFNCANSQGSA